MMDSETLCVLIAELVPLLATLFSLVYGLKHFFKKGKPMFLQTLTMAMASHALGSVYHLCQSLTSMANLMAASTLGSMEPALNWLYFL